MKQCSARFLSATFLVVGTLLPFTITLANPTRPMWEGLTGGCPADSHPYGIRVYTSSCQSAVDAADASMPACRPTATPVGDATPCPTGSAEPGPFQGWHGQAWNAGNNNFIRVLAFPFCPDGGQMIGTDDGLVCSPEEYSPPKTCENCTEGNPIVPAVGNKTQEETDYAGSGPFPLRFVRYYNSRSSGQGAHRSLLGMPWTHTYSRSLLFNDAGLYNVVTAAREDGRVLAFARASITDPYLNEVTSSETLTKTADGWRLVTADDQTELYDSSGRLTSVSLRSGLTQTLSYDSNGRLASVVDPFGRSLSFSYDGASRLQTMTAPNGVYQYVYAEPRTKIHSQVIYPDTRSRTYQYIQIQTTVSPPQFLLTGIIDENGVQYASFGYDSSGWATSTEHAGGAGKVVIVNDASSGIRNVSVTRFVSATQSAARTYSYQSVLGRAKQTAVTGQPCPTCGALASTYDANANLSSRTDWNGNRTNYGYDLARNLETVRTEGLTSAGGTTPQTRTTTTEWHPSFRLLKRIAEPLRITTYVYNGDAGASCGVMSDGITLVPGVLCSKTIQATTDTNGAAGFGATVSGTARTWTYTYNENGSVLTMDGPRTDVADTTVYTYYANSDPDLGKRGNVATVTNAAGHTTSITAYHANGQPLTIVDPNGLTTTLAYDPRMRLTSRTVGGETTAYTYDNAGQLTKVTLPDLSFLSYSYDAAHRLTGMQDNLGNRIAYTLDLAGNRTNEEVRDPANALAQTRSRVYSNINRLFQELGASGQTTEYAYDDQGNVTSVKDPLNHITANQYDPLNRLKQVTDPASGVTQYAYNGLDSLTQVTDPRSLVTGYTVDGLGNLSQQVSPDTGTTTNTYDVAGNLLTQTDAKSQTTSYTYDALNRVTLITFHDGSKQAYVYDQGANGLGRLSSITERDSANQVTSVIAYAYEQHGRVTSETRTVNGVSYVLAYQYDSAGRLSGMTYPSGRTVTYGFDALGRVNQVSTTKGSATQIAVQNVTYHPFGGVKGFTKGNGQTYSRTYDQDGRVSSYTLGASQFAIAYDAASRIEVISDVANPANSNTYGYDALDRLIQATLPSTPFAYLYDAVGNRVSKTAGSASETYTYSPTSNRLATLTPTSGPARTFNFDLNGSTVSDGLNSYVYDARGRMKQATSAAGTTDYQVNALGQRIRKTNSADDRVFHYDTRGKLIAESDPGGGAYKRELIYLGDIPVMVFQ